MARPSASTHELVPGDQIAPADWHAAFTAAFADYLIGPFQLTPAQWPGFLARQGADLPLSRGVVVDGELRAFALVAPRPSVARWRLATMGAVPAARGSGLAPVLLDDFIARAAAAGAATVELEVFAANERAVHLYRGRGFEVVHALHGHERAADAGPLAEPAPMVEPVALDQAWAWLDEAETRIADLPLQVTANPLAAAAAAAPGTLHAWQCGQAQLVFADRPGEPIIVQSLVDHDPAQPGAEALVRELIAASPGRALHVPALQRPDLGGDALQRAGFVHQPLHQWFMRAPTLPAGRCPTRGPLQRTGEAGSAQAA